ncbi:hypothetical protein MBLNU230_g0257t1 [Neophaeotheca triangularis]
MAQVTLRDALEHIESNAIRQRNEGLSDLKHILRHNQSNPKVETLGDASFHRILEVLFKVAVNEQSTYIKSKTPTTRSAAEGRLSACAGALRLAVEVGVKSLKLKSIRALLDHLMQTISIPSGGYCEPIALDYAKCLKSLLSYQPHVEHLPGKEWERAATFCLDSLVETDVDPEDSDNRSGLHVPSTNGTSGANGQSYRSSRSGAKEPAASQGVRSVNKQVSDELVGTLRLLTAAPNANVTAKASSLIEGLIQYLRQSTLATKAHQDAFATVNNIVKWAITEAIDLVQGSAVELLRLIRHFWSTKSSSLKDELLISMILLRPTVENLLRQSTPTPLRIELSGLLQVLSLEYSKRLDRDQLSLDNIRLESISDRRRARSDIHTPLFVLKCHGARVEHQWALVSVMASFYEHVYGAETREDASDHDDEDAERRPRKRQRLTSSFDEMLDGTLAGLASARACHLQILAFQILQQAFSPKRLTRTFDKLAISGAAEDSEVVSWAFVAIAGCASQVNSAHPSLSERWKSIWQVATRAISIASTCRSACFLLLVLMRLQLVDQATINELMQRITISVDLNGPVALSDCALRLMNTTLKAIRETNAALAVPTAEATLGWILRRFTPSRYEDRQYTSISNQCEAEDLLWAIGACLNQEKPSFAEPSRFQQWDIIAQSWLHVATVQPLTSYLLLLPEPGPYLHDYTRWQKYKHPVSTTNPPDPSCEALLLNTFCSELRRINETWSRWTKERSRNISLDMFTSICSSVFVAIGLATGSEFRDRRRKAELMQHVDRLLETTITFTSSSSCTQDKTDVLLHTFCRAFTGLSDTYVGSNRNHPELEQKLCTAVYKIFLAQQDSLAHDAGDDDDMMDLDQPNDSQDSKRGDSKQLKSILTNDLAVLNSPAALRAATQIYATAIHMFTSSANDEHHADDISVEFVDFLLSLPETTLIEGREVVANLPNLGLHLGLSDTERLLESLTENVLSVYAFERSEVALGTILDVMSSMTTVWANPENKALFGLGVDMYAWFTTTALSAGVLSSSVQQRVATMLLQLCDVDTDYGSDEDVPSVRTSLFKLLKQGSINVQYHLADKISTIFARFTLSAHEAMFDDLQESLPAAVDWKEGIAVRLLFLAKLASAWHSLLRRCIYYIFETAGRVKGSTLYAAHCVKDVASALAFDSPRKIFTLFAPQLLHTWLEENTVTSLPFEAFHYSSLEELLRNNESEVISQLLMRGFDDGMQAVSSALKTDIRSIVERSFGKALAYSMSWDLVHGNTDAGSEARLRTIIGSKELLKELAVQRFPVTAAHFFLSMQQNESDLERQLARKQEYAYALQALRDIKGYSHSDKNVLTNQQPSFKSRYILDQLERLCRRASQNAASAWDPSAFNLSVRILLAGIEEALGSLHTCTMIRKVRTLICVAGDVATNGFALEMLLHSLHPFLRDSQCADDTLGIVRYLLTRGRSYLETRPEFLTGTATLILLSLKTHVISKQASTTQESQHQATVKKMQEFEAWLVKYLKDFRRSVVTSNKARYDTMASSLSGTRLPGNGLVDSPESILLLQLLHERQHDEPLLSQSDCTEAIKMLTREFRRPMANHEDQLGSDESSARYATALLPALKMPGLDRSFYLWVAGAVGRAYASTGIRPGVSKGVKSSATASDDKLPDVFKSQTTIAQELSRALLSRSRSRAALADYVLRRIVNGFRQVNDVEGVVAFENMLATAIPAAIAHGTYGYEPPGVEGKTTASVDRTGIRSALSKTTSSFEEWCIELATTLCCWAADVPILAPLPTIFIADGSMAFQMLPSILHILLSSEMDRDAVVRSELSAAMQHFFASKIEDLRSRQKFLLEVVLYLRTMTYPGERTKVDRVRWLEIDYISAADCASRCGLPTSALLLAETATPTPSKGNRRVSSRASLSQLPPEPVPDSLLLSIFKQVDEPDSFYGVQQSSTLSSVLERLDYEGDGLKSLMFRSAQMDSRMQSTHSSSTVDGAGMTHSLATLGLSSVTFAILSGKLGQPASSGQMLSAAKKLQQWDVTVVDTEAEDTMIASFRALQEISRASQLSPLQATVENDLIQPLLGQMTDQQGRTLSSAFFSTLASLTEMTEVLRLPGEDQSRSLWAKMALRQSWMQLSKFEDFEELATNRPALFGALGQNRSILDALHLSPKTCRVLQVKALLSVSELARKSGRLQDALSAATHVSDLALDCNQMGMQVEAAAKSEVAKVLWGHGEAAASVSLLREVLAMKDIEKQTVPVGRSGIMAQVGHQLANARLEKPEIIMNDILKRAIEHLGNRREGQEAGEVFFEFANFCDQQLQNPGNLEDFRRIARLREQKKAELMDIEELEKGAKRSHEKQTLQREASKTRQWFNLDDAEYQRLLKSRKAFAQQSLQNYLHALQASDDHNICALRFFALWLENADMSEANGIVSKYLPFVASWKFVLLMNQLISRLKDEPSTFQSALRGLLSRIMAEHPYHSLHHLFAATRRPPAKEETATSRANAAATIRTELFNIQSKQQLMQNWFAADNMYHKLAKYELDDKRKGNKVQLATVPPALEISKKVPQMQLPPPTVPMALRPNGDYSDTPLFTRVSSNVLVMNGLSTPMVLTITSSDGKQQRALFKSGNDDLRQDAIMEQVFEEVSKMLQDHKATQQRNLHIRTYKVIPLSTQSGIIEFVANSMPINDYLAPAHKKYYPTDVKNDEARNSIRKVEKDSIETRIKTFRKITDNLHPVMRHFFLERFDDPDEWFQKRTAYTRTTAAISILGYVLGLGDRHCHNILLDEEKGDVIHIDLGVAFEAGRVLPIPENVPFRLTRDIVDGMGVTQTEGVFRRCCEFTMDALRQDKDSIMTLLNVLRYDPLYEWSMSPLRAKRMQDAAEDTNAAGGVPRPGEAVKAGSWGTEQEAGEAERALSVVEKKLSKTLSTSATVNELIQQATDEKNLATLFAGWSAYY